MNLEASLRLLADSALATPVEDNLALYDAIRCVATAVGCSVIADRAAATAAAIREADSAQLRFRELLHPEGHAQ